VECAAWPTPCGNARPSRGEGYRPPREPSRGPPQFPGNQTCVIVHALYTCLRSPCAWRPAERRWHAPGAARTHLARSFELHPPAARQAARSRPRGSPAKPALELGSVPTAGGARVRRAQGPPRKNGRVVAAPRAGGGRLGGGPQAGRQHAGEGGPHRQRRGVGRGGAGGAAGVDGGPGPAGRQHARPLRLRRAHGAQAARAHARHSHRHDVLRPGREAHRTVRWRRAAAPCGGSRRARLPARFTRAAPCAHLLPAAHHSTRPTRSPSLAAGASSWARWTSS
jgi:hypothetical protein